MTKRRINKPGFKAKLAIKVISGRKTIQQIAANHAIHLLEVDQWKTQLTESASRLFMRE